MTEFARDLLEMTRSEALRPVYPGKWSPLQIGSHLVLTNRLFADAVAGFLDSGEPLELPKGSLSAAGTMVAPEMTVPRDLPEPEDAARDLQLGAAELVRQVIRSQESGVADRICLVHPFFGPLNAIECLQLALVHVRHHQRQMPL